MSACSCQPEAGPSIKEPVDTDRPGVGEVVGTDPAGTQWRVVRYAEDWAKATLHDAVYSPSRSVVELASILPATMSPDEDGRPRRLPLETLTVPSGDQYRSKPSTGQILRRVSAEQDFSPLSGFGGLGTPLGQCRQPAGLGWHPTHGHLLLADSGNHRVQVIRPQDGSVVLALGKRDVWGAPMAAEKGGGMQEPVDVAVDPCSCTIFVADRAGLIHVFDGRYRYLRSFSPIPELAPAFDPAPVAIAVLEDGSVAVADPAWPRLLIFDAFGVRLTELGLHELDHPRFAGLRLASSFAAEGEVLIGPIDSGIHDVAWHELRLEAELPAGTQVQLQSWASNSASSTAAEAQWAPREPVAVVHGETGRFATRLVQSDWESWKTWRGGDLLDPPPAGTDRGRYLFVRLRILGQLRRPSDTVSLATPSISGLYARFPRPTLLAHLPGRWSRRDELQDPAGALFVERYLAMFERVLTDMEVKLEDLPRLLNPRTAPGPWLDWIATWLNLAFDPSWDVERRRALVREAISLYKMRGTPKGLARYIEIYTGLPPSIVEGFATRSTGEALTLNEGTLGTLPLGPEEDVDPDAGAHRFEIYANLGQPEDLELTRAVVRRIVESEKPAHTDYTLHMVLPDARVGCQSTVGIDLVLGHSLPLVTPICAEPGGGANQPALGTLRLDPTGPSTSSSTPTLDQAGVVVDDTFLLT